jgi:hypothetical protein
MTTNDRQIKFIPATKNDKNKLEEPPYEKNPADGDPSGRL